MSTINGVSERDIPNQVRNRDRGDADPASILPYEKYIDDGEHPVVEAPAAEVKPEDVMPGNVVVIPSERKAFCVVCGPLEIVNGEVQHPKMDAALVKLLDSGFTTTYTHSDRGPATPGEEI